MEKTMGDGRWAMGTAVCMEQSGSTMSDTGNLMRCASQPLVLDPHAIDVDLTPDESRLMGLSVVNELSDTSIEEVQSRP